MLEYPNSPMISVIIPVYNGTKTLTRCLEAVTSSDYPNYECIVVDDSSTDDSRDIAQQFSVRIHELSGGPSGPAHARNIGAQAASGDVVFFVDADVVICHDTVTKVAETFVRHPEIDAMFGSYDDSPEAGDFSSQFKNLYHHFTHQQQGEQAVTFWSGCGAVRREVFLEAGGFDADRYPRPSIEDIELGYRLSAAGHGIMLNGAIQVKHLKRWTLRGMLMADIFDRAIPWTLLILRQRELPQTLNLSLSQRASALLLCVLLLHLSLTAFFHNIVLLPLIAGLFFVVVGYWNLSERVPPLRGMTRRANKITIFLVVAIGALALYYGRPFLLPPLGLVLIGTLIGHRWARSSRALRHLLFVVLILGLLGAFAILVTTFSIWLLTPMIGLVATIVLLNIKLYAFFIRKRGVVFAFAAIPFHLLYYFYSVLAFAVAKGMHTWNTSLRR